MATKYSVQLRENRNGSWWANGTIEGRDVSFEGKTIGDAQHQMMQYVQLLCHPVQIEWDKPKRYAHEEQITKPHIGYQKVRIDHNPIG